MTTSLAALLAEDIVPIFVITGALLVVALAAAGLIHMAVQKALDRQSAAGLRPPPRPGEVHGDGWRP